MEIDIDCPECKRSFKVTLDDISRGRVKRCPSGHEVQLVDQGGGAREAQKAYDDLDRALKKFGR